MLSGWAGVKSKVIKFIDFFFYVKIRTLNKDFAFLFGLFTGYKQTHQIFHLACVAIILTYFVFLCELWEIKISHSYSVCLLPR